MRLVWEQLLLSATTSKKQRAADFRGALYCPHFDLGANKKYPAERDGSKPKEGYAMAECSHTVKNIDELEKLVSEENCPIHLKHEGKDLIETVQDPDDFKRRKLMFKRKIGMYMELNAFTNLASERAKY